MVQQLYCEKISELKRERKFLERTFRIKITLKGRQVIIEGDAISEYEIEKVIEAINLGFPARTATLLKDPEYLFEKINIKDHTRRKNLDVVRGRLIGTHGRTKKTIEQISGCEIVIHDNDVGIIGPAENVPQALTAITNVIKGTKQTNAYKYLEKINTQRKKQNKKL